MTVIEEIIGLVNGITTGSLKNDKADLLIKLADLKIEIAGFKDENQKLKELVKSLQEEKDNPLVFEGGFYFAADDADRKNPYCPNCYEVKKIRTHLVEFKCHNCNAKYPPENSGPVILTSRGRESQVLEGY